MRRYGQVSRSHAPAGAYHSPRVFMDDDFWVRNFPRFTILARRRMATARPVAGMEPADYVLAAAELLMSGRRRCRAKYTPESCVQGVIDSLISHASADLENSFGHDSLSDGEDDAPNRQDTLPASETSVEDDVGTRERLASFRDGFADPLHRQYIDLVAGGCDSAADAATALGVTLSVVRNIVKVVRRRRAQWPGTARSKTT